MNECANFDTDRDVDVVGARRLRLRIRGLVQGVGFRPRMFGGSPSAIISPGLP